MKFLIILFSFIISSPAFSVVAVRCVRIQKSEDICNTFSNVAILDTVLGGGDSFVQAVEKAESRCAGKQDCQITDCVNTRLLSNNLADEDHRVVCNCSYKLDNQCGSVGQIESISVTVTPWIEGIANVIYSCYGKLREHNIPDSALPFLHDCSVTAVPIATQ